MRIATFIAPMAALGVAGLINLRHRDRRADISEWSRLAALQPASPARFDLTMTQSLPAPAQRFFRFAIMPGTPLWPIAAITMEGKFGMGDKTDPKFIPMRARQILAAPHGFVWQM